MELCPSQAFPSQSGQHSNCCTNTLAIDAYPLSLAHRAMSLTSPQWRRQTAAWETRQRSGSGNPDSCCNATARSVQLIVNHGSGAAAPTKALLHVIDDANGNVQALWHSLGAPNKPNSAQLAQLKLASAAGIVPVTVVAINGTATVVTVPMTENSAVVVEYL